MLVGEHVALINELALAENLDRWIRIRRDLDVWAIEDS